jgi:hypothetical protein
MVERILVCLVRGGKGASENNSWKTLSRQRAAAEARDGIHREKKRIHENTVRRAAAEERERKLRAECEAKKRIYMLAITGRRHLVVGPTCVRRWVGLKTYLKRIQILSDKLKKYLGQKNLSYYYLKESGMHRTPRRINDSYNVVKQIINETLPFYRNYIQSKCGNIEHAATPPPHFLKLLTDEEKKILREGPENYCTLGKRRRNADSTQIWVDVVLVSTLGPEYQWKSLI